MKQRHIIIGYSGHAFVMIESLKSMGLIPDGYCETAEKELNPYGLSFLGNEKDPAVLEKLKDACIYIGIGSNELRKSIHQWLVYRGLSLPPVIHACAISSASATIGDGSLLAPGCIVNAMAVIGRSVICNTSSIIEHECRIGDFSHIAPGAVLAGNVSVGTGSFIGANAVVKEGVKIGNHVLIGAGTVVIRDVVDNACMVGNPQKELNWKK